MFSTKNKQYFLIRTFLLTSALSNTIKQRASNSGLKSHMKEEGMGTGRDVFIVTHSIAPQHTNLNFILGLCRCDTSGPNRGGKDERQEDPREGIDNPACCS